MLLLTSSPVAGRRGLRREGEEEVGKKENMRREGPVKVEPFLIHVRHPEILINRTLLLSFNITF